MIMKRIAFVLVCLSLNASAQVLKPDTTGTYFSEMWNVYNTHKRISYIAFYPWMKVNENPGLPLLFEANISPYFTFFRGRDYGDYGYSRPQLKSLLIYFNPELLLRMYREDPIGTKTKSLPVLPINFAPRLSFVKFLHRSDVQNRIENFQDYQFLELSIAHYSNGQEDPHNIRNMVKPNGDSIPNYRSGNFSTNYWRLGYTRGWMNGNYGIASANLYIQNDGGAGDLFSYDPAQEQRYGRWRLGFTLQYHSGKTKVHTKKEQKVGLEKIDEPGDENGKNYKFKPRKLKDFDYYITWMVRFTNETIIDDVGLYPSPKRRNSSRLTLLAHPLNWRNVAVMAEYYIGRDFYNIRFYDAVSQFKIGLVAEPAFYIPRNTYK